MRRVDPRGSIRVVTPSEGGSDLMGKQAKANANLWKSNQKTSPEHPGASLSPPSTYGAKRTLSFADTPR